MRRLIGWLRSLFRREREPGREFNLVWDAPQARRWGRDGQPCRVIGKANVPGMAVVEFPDGVRFIVERLGLAPRGVA